MKFRVLSDLHIDVNRYHTDLFNWKNKDILTVIAGDVSGSIQLTAPFLRKRFKNVIFIGGNHIVYNDDYKPLQQLHQDYRTEFPLASTISYLENEKKEIDDVVFIGATLWTDYTYYNSRAENMMYAAIAMNDFRFGRFEENGADVQLQPQHCLDMFNESLSFIKTTYDKFVGTGKKIVLVVHHGVSPKAITGRYIQNTKINAAYTSDLEDYITRELPCLALIVHGHVHTRVQYQIGSIPVVCNPCGYIDYDEEAPAWRKNLIVEI